MDTTGTLAPSPPTGKIDVKQEQEQEDDLKDAAGEINLESDRKKDEGIPRQCGIYLQFATARERKDPRIVAQATDQDERALRYADQSLLADRAFMLSMVKKNGRHLRFASRALKDDIFLVQAAILSWGSALQWASPRLRSDRNLCFEAVMRRGCMLHHVSRKCFVKFH